MCLFCSYLISKTHTYVKVTQQGPDQHLGYILHGQRVFEETSLAIKY